MVGGCTGRRRASLRDFLACARLALACAAVLAVVTVPPAFAARGGGRPGLPVGSTPTPTPVAAVPVPLPGAAPVVGNGLPSAPATPTAAVGRGLERATQLPSFTGPTGLGIAAAAGRGRVGPSA